MKDTLCTDGGHSPHQFGVNLVGFHAIIFYIEGLPKRYNTTRSSAIVQLLTTQLIKAENCCELDRVGAT